MSKIINISSLRNGVGRSTVACILGGKLSEQGYKVLLIDNNFKFCDLANYLLVDVAYTVDDIIPFIRTNTIEKETLTSVFIPVDKNLDLLAGSKMTNVDNTLNRDNLLRIKELLDDEYDYILVDNKAGIENKNLLSMLDIIDISIVVTQASTHDIKHFENLMLNLSKEEREVVKSVIARSLAVLNKTLDGYAHELKLFELDKVYKLKYCSKLLDFCNGYDANMFASNKDELNKLYTAITNKAAEDVRKKKGLLGGILKKKK